MVEDLLAARGIIVSYEAPRAMLDNVCFLGIFG
jgi:hypothetical protein